MSLTALLSFSDLGGAIDRILRENYRSIEAARSMIEALERQDSAFLTYLTDQGSLHKNIVADGKKTFEDAFQSAWSNITLAGEHELLSGIKSQYEEYSQEGEYLEQSDSKEARMIYNDRLVPLFGDLKFSCRQLTSLNLEAMMIAEKKASLLASSSSASIIIITVLGLLVVIFMGHVMTRNIITPLKSVTWTTERIAQGNLETRVHCSGNNEIAHLANAINVLTDTLSDTRAAEKTKLSRATLLALALLNSETCPSFVIDGEAHIVLSNVFLEPLFTTDRQFREKVLSLINSSDSAEQIVLNSKAQPFQVTTVPLYDSGNRQVGRKVRLEPVDPLS